MAWSHFQHEADIGLIGTGPDKAQAFEAIAMALTAAVTDPASIAYTQSVAIHCSAPNDELHEAMLAGTDREVLGRIMARLIEHTRSHFAYEEGLMLEHGYPGYDAHRAEHGMLLQQVLDLSDGFQRGELLLSFAVVLELKGWATVHIEKSDKLLADFLIRQEQDAEAPG